VQVFRRSALDERSTAVTPYCVSRGKAVEQDARDLWWVGPRSLAGDCDFLEMLSDLESSEAEDF
jgi:hypothetical protein